MPINSAIELVTVGVVDEAAGEHVVGADYAADAGDDDNDSEPRVFLGGPMMGMAAPTLDLSITKGTSGVTALTDAAAERTHSHVYPCIRCGYCLDACPISLNPSDLGVLAKNHEYQRMADERHLMDCFECGSCSFVCPSHIPLVQMFRVAKASLRKARANA